MEFTEAQLIKALEGRDEGQRHRALYWFYYSSGIPDKARNVLRKLEAEEANLEDAVQEGIVALVRAIRHGSFRSESRLSTYFVSICRNIYLKKYRPRHVIANMDQLPAEPGYEAPDWKLMEEEQRGLLAALLKSALGKLRKKCREALEMYKLEYPMKVIAEELDITEQSAKNRVHRCRGKLRELMLSNAAVMNIVKSRG